MDLRASYKIAVLTLASAMLIACVPDVEEADTLVDGPRVLAIRAEPAEAEKNQEVTLTALYADASGTLEEAPLDWAFCTERKSLAELGPVSPACIARRSDVIEPLGEGDHASGDVPADTCRLFGPDRPTPKMGEPAGRPVDADPTGGYYQPVRVLDGDLDEYSLFEMRITCGLPGASQALAAEYAQRYAANENPELESVGVYEGDDQEPLSIADEDEPREVVVGEALRLRAHWARCEPLDLEAECDGEDGCAPPPSCSGSEHYVRFDPQSLALQARQEAMRVSWFSTAGSFRDARTGRTEAQASDRYSDNVWTAPNKPGDVTLWVVLRDDRGGVGWQTFALHVVAH